jgi:hypothetical protein
MITTGPKETQNVKDKNKMKKTGRKSQRIYTQRIYQSLEMRVAIPSHTQLWSVYA